MEVRCAVGAGDMLGETPLWCAPTGRLWWIDVEGPCLQSLDPATGAHERHRLPRGLIGSVALRRDGGFLVALDAALHFFEPTTGALAPFLAVEGAGRGTRLNDGRCDGQGRFWVGTMDVGLAEPNGALYCVHPDGTVERHADGIIVSNGVAVSPDQRTLYFSDTRRFVTWAFDLDAAAGRLSGRRVFVDYTDARERPDGACVDAEGFVWTAIFAGGRIDRLDPSGRRERSIALPVTNPTCPCFGGRDLETLYVTTARKFLTPQQLAAEPWAGAVLALEPGMQGLPEHRFAA
ncbi:MAG: SMP-30/gluconolactonase/LRE family protein [Alphaproteobacteria bacterium]